MLFSIPKVAAIAILSQCLLSAAAVPQPRALDTRATSECQKNDIVKVVNVLKKFPVIGSKICSNLLKYPPPRTVTQSTTITNTVKTTVTGSTTTTLVAGTSTVAAAAVATSTVAVGSPTTSTETITQTDRVTTETVTETKTSSVVAPTTTVTTTVFNSPPVKKRQSGRKLGDVYPDCPKDLKSTLLEIATTACKCFLGPAESPKTKTVTVTQSATSTINAVGTSTTSRPATTVTSTSTSTTTVTVTTPSTIKTTVTSTATVNVIDTTTTTSTTTSTPTATVTVTVSTSYTKINEGASCTYNRYTDGFGADNSPNNNYSVGINQCKGYCDARTDCKYFFYLRFDPARARGADYGFCFIDNQPYDAAFLQCGYPTQKYASYQKN